MTTTTRIGLALCALALFACGGGGGGGGDTGNSVIPPPPTPPAEEDPGTLVVVRYDVTGDSNPDLVTLDAADSPMTIVEALQGTDTGTSIDVTETMKGQQIDPAVSEALAGYLVDSMELGAETDLDVTDTSGKTLTVTVFE